MRSLSLQLSSPEVGDPEKLERDMRQLTEAFRNHQAAQRRARWLAPMLLGRLEPDKYEGWDVE